MNKIILALLLTTALAAPAIAQNCVNSSRCDELGYKQTINECLGFNPLICPFDKNKAHCLLLGRFYNCSDIKAELNQANNRVIAQGNIENCNNLTIADGTAFIGAPNVTLQYLSSLGSIIQSGSKSTLQNITAGNLSSESTGDIQLRGCNFTNVFSFNKITLSGANYIKFFKKATTLKTSADSFLTTSKIDDVISLDLNGVIKVTGQNNNDGIYAYGTNQISNAVIVFPLPGTNELYFSNINQKKDIYLHSNVRFQYSKIYGNLYVNADTAEAKFAISYCNNCTNIFYGKTYFKGDFVTLGINYHKFSSGAEVYFDGTSINNCSAAFESGVTIGIKYPTSTSLNGLWKTVKECNINLGQISSSDCVERIGEFKGISLPEFPL